MSKMIFPEIVQGSIVLFDDDKLSYLCLGRSNCGRYAIFRRSFSSQHDSGLLACESDGLSVENSGEIVYSVVDFERNVRGPHNLISNPYDFNDHSSVCGCLDDLVLGMIEVSRRNSVDLLVHSVDNVDSLSSGNEVVVATDESTGDQALYFNEVLQEIEGGTVFACDIKKAVGDSVFRLSTLTVSIAGHPWPEKIFFLSMFECEGGEE